MKGANILATMQKLGVVPSFSRSSVSNDNPFSESLFKTLKNRNEIYEAAKIKNPSRWSGKTRNWDAVTAVKLNPLKEKNKSITTGKLQQAC